jgi:putative alpha-1,2-mannosidase
MNELYFTVPDCYPGNDDVGEMSSWYIFAALGMYPELPGSDIMVPGSPLFSKAILHLKAGNVTITAKVAGKDVPYVQSLRVNGRLWSKPRLRFSDICHSGTLAYKLTGKPDTNWGSDTADVL